jgi:pectinesterase
LDRISAPDFRAENLTIENSFDYHANQTKADDDPTKLREHPHNLKTSLKTKGDIA